MKRKSVLIVFILVMCNIQSVFAAPYMSFVPNKHEEWSYSPSLYEPLTTINVDLTMPTDIFVDPKDNVYILEEERLIFLDHSNREQILIDEGQLKRATGLFVDEEYIYIADKGAESVKIFTLSGEEVRVINRPANPLYGKRENFIPTKIAVSKSKGLYVVSDGNANGIVQMTFEGDFVGYYGSNDANSNFFQRLKEKVLKDTPLGRFIKVTPTSVHNVDIDEKGVIYASSIGNVEDRVRRLNVAGKNIFTEEPINEYLEKIEDIAVNEHFVIMLDSATGMVALADKSGNPIGVFGSKTNTTPVTGLFLAPVAVDIDSEGRIYVLDYILENVQVFTPTLLMSNIFEASILYNKGLYSQSQDSWEEVINLNPVYALGNKSMGLIERKDQNYEKALDYFYRANDKEGYSQALWEIRQNLITKYLGLVMLLGIALYCLVLIYQKFLSKTKAVIRLEEKGQMVGNIKFVQDVKMLGKTLRKPNDVFYDIRVENNISVYSAIVLLLSGVIISAVSQYLTNYLFTSGKESSVSISSHFMWVVGLSLLFVISNFLITSILDGEGKVKHIFIGTVYALAPMLVLLIPIALFSRGLTLNEMFFINLLNFIVYAGIATLLLIMVIEVHNYRFMESVKVMLLTLFTMILLVVIGISLYALFNQIITFVLMIFKELIIRV